MKPEKAIEIIKTEAKCVARGENCDRDCAKCDLVMDSKDILEAFTLAIRALEDKGN